MSNSGTESFDNTEDITEEMFDHVFSLNVRAQFFIGKAAWNHLEDNGRLILMSSISAGKIGIKRHALYSSSKMAVIGMVKSFATDFGARRITVNGIAPGGVLSDMFYQNCWNYIPGELFDAKTTWGSCTDRPIVGATPDWPAKKLETLTAKSCPLGRCALLEDIAHVVAFLASEDGGWVNGESNWCIARYFTNIVSQGRS
jgi:3-oxoacyl-[acyl-carrier protein] reductase